VSRDEPAPGAPGIDVLLVAPALEYSAPTLYALTLAQGLASRGLAVRLLTPGGRLSATFRDAGISLDEHPFLDRFFVDWFLMRKLVKDLRATGVGIVHSVSSLKVGSASTLGRRLGAPVTATVHRRYDPASRLEIDWSNVSGIITFSEDLRVDAVNHRGAPKDRVRVIPAGISTPPPHPPPFARAGAVPIVGTLGDVEKMEAQVDFICAASLVLAEEKDVEFLIVSGGAEPRALRALARDLGIARHVTFTTFSDTQKNLSLMDICVLPGAEEGPTQAIIEAMAAGRPVITSGAGGAFGVIEDERTGLICEKPVRSGAAALPRTREEAAARGGHLARAILRLTRDQGAARRIGAAARAHALESFPLDRMLDETIAIFDHAKEKAAALRTG